jgi:hypothetical protein
MNHTSKKMMRALVRFQHDKDVPFELQIHQLEKGVLEKTTIAATG